MRPSRQTLLRKLRELHVQVAGDHEAQHSQADQLLLDFIDDPEIAQAYNAITKWYA